MTQHEALELLNQKGKVEVLDLEDYYACVGIKAGNASVTLKFTGDIHEKSLSFKDYDCPNICQFEPFDFEGEQYESIEEVCLTLGDIYANNNFLDDDIDEMNAENQREADDIEDTNNSLWSQWSPRD